MPTTPRLALPYPASSDTADVPRDLKALAERVEALTGWIRSVDLVGGVLNAGDLRFTAVVVASPTAIPGWLLCDGGSYLRTDPLYVALFSAIGTVYGAVDGTHFNVPDFRGRVPSGVGFSDAPGATDHALASKFGSESAFLGIGEIPAAAGANGYESHTATVGAAQSGAGQAVLTSLNTVLKNTIASFTQTARTLRAQPSLTVNVLIKL